MIIVYKENMMRNKQFINQNIWSVILIMSTLIFSTLFSCKSNKKEIVILAMNDVYRINGLYDGEIGGLARVRSLRSKLEKRYPELLVLHAGDFLYPLITLDTRG